MKSKKAFLILLLILEFSGFEICLAENFPGFFCKERIIFLEEASQVIISFTQDIDIDTQGNIWIIDWKTSQLYKFNKDGDSPTLIANSGRGPCELSSPQSIFIDQNDHIFIANFGSRITEFDAEGNYVSSFVTIDGHVPTNCIAVTKEGFILIGGPKKRRVGNSIKGQMIHMYSPKGKYIKSFCQMDEKVSQLNLGRYCAVHFDLDENDNIYTVQAVNFKIVVFDKNGNLKKRFGERQKYYKEPKLLTKKIERNKDKMENYRNNFTYVQDIYVFDGKLAVLSRNYPGKNGRRFRYFIDIYECKSGKLLAGGVESYMNLFRVKNGKFYFFKTLEKGEPGNVQSIIEVWRLKDNEK